MIAGPDSSYSSLEIHICWKVEREAKIDPNPDRVFSFWRSNDLDLHGRWSKSNQFLVHSFSNTREHRRSSRQDNISVQVFSDINITFHDGVVSSLVNSSRFHTQERWLEKSFWASESFVTNGDNLTVGKFVRFFQSRG